uniref:Group XV phospholipase A2 n=1 Tax=Ditylenchus dipsaci TaxID=166011 RepID=A0A915CQL5_9BILA
MTIDEHKLTQQLIFIAVCCPLCYYFIVCGDDKDESFNGCFGERSNLENISNVYYTPYKRKEGDPTKPSNPIVLSDGGSRLRANLTGKPDTVHYLCSKKTSDFYDLLLGRQYEACFQHHHNVSENAPGVDVEVFGFGNTDTVEWLDSSKWSPGLYFANIVDALVSWGYTRGKNVAGAPYDWRKSPPELKDYYIQLRTLIEILYRYNNNTRVVVLGHSMGNPIMNYFYHNYVDQTWKDKYVEAHVSLAGAWGGSLQIMKLFASGYNMDYYRIILPPSALRGMQRSFTSSAYLLTEVGPPGVKVHCLYGIDVKTAEQFVWAKGYFPEYQPTTIVYGDGDGTVNIRSLETCKQWNESNNAGKSSQIYPLSKADHMGILRDQRTIDTLRSVLYP